MRKGFRLQVKPHRFTIRKVVDIDDRIVARASIVMISPPLLFSTPYS